MPTASLAPEIPLNERLGESGRRTDARMAELLPPEEASPRELSGAIRYAALGPGKRMRPALVMLAGEACGVG